MRIVPSPTSSEHWLTLMTCTICSNTPDNSPVYKCNLGHTICYPCFQKLVGTGFPVCNICESDQFTRHDVSNEFLRKLKVKPGIGRPHRYMLSKDGHKMTSDFKDILDTDAVTVEKLFQLSTSKLQQLFDDSTKEKQRLMNNYTVAACRDLPSKINLHSENRDTEINTVKSLADESSKIWLKKITHDSRSVINFNSSCNSLHSRKPLKCPHDPCNKIIAVSSFQSHLKYEHFDFKSFSLQRGKEMMLVFNPSVIQHGRTLCVGIIKLYENDTSKDCTRPNVIAASKIRNRIEINTFWVMVSGSPDDSPKNAYAIFWLFTNNDVFYNCTMELSSQHDVMTSATFCGVNGIHESQNISEVTQRLNCLFLTQGTLKSMLTYGPMLKLRISIH